jgi:hypothetical protein
MQRKGGSQRRLKTGNRRKQSSFAVKCFLPAPDRFWSPLCLELPQCNEARRQHFACVRPGPAARDKGSPFSRGVPIFEDKGPPYPISLWVPSPHGIGLRPSPANKCTCVTPNNGVVTRATGRRAIDCSAPAWPRIAAM